MHLRAFSVLHEEFEARNRYNVEWIFEGVLYFGWSNQPSSGTVPFASLYLKKAGLASRNIVHLQKSILRCIGFCLQIPYFIREAD